MERSGRYLSQNIAGQHDGYGDELRPCSATSDCTMQDCDRDCEMSPLVLRKQLQPVPVMGTHLLGAKGCSSSRSNRRLLILNSRTKRCPLPYCTPPDRIPCTQQITAAMTF